VHSARQGRVHWGGDHRVGLAQRADSAHVSALDHPLVAIRAK